METTFQEGGQGKEMRICLKCGVGKPEDHFNRQRARKDGFQVWCKDCKAEHQRQYQVTPKGRAVRARYERSAKGLIALRRKAAARRISYPEKQKAHNLVRTETRSGRLTHQPCERCGWRGKTEAHHEDYSKPFDVIWLCRQCHLKHHKEEDA